MKSQINLYSNLILEKLFLQKNFLKDYLIVRSTDGKKINFTDFLLQIDSVAISLVERGFKRENKVLFLAKPSIESIIYIFAIIRAGGILILADPAMGKENFAGRVSFVKPDYILIDSILDKLIRIPYIEALTKIFGVNLPDINTIRLFNKIVVGKQKKQLNDFHINTIYLNDRNDSVIIFTSGTTGTPKGVVHTNASLFETLKKIEKILIVKRTDIFYSSQLHFLLASIVSGAQVILPSNINFSAKKYYRDILKFKVNKTFGIPAEYSKIIDFCSKNIAKLPVTLETVVLGSAPVLKGFLSKLSNIISKNTKVICVYGATEILPIAYVELQNKISANVEGDLLGEITEGVDIKIIGNEICVSGKNLFDRYLGFEKIKEHHTGDFGSLNGGNLILLGRKKDMIIRGNYNIYPSIFESTISEIKGIKSCAIVGIYDEKIDDEKVYLVVDKEQWSTENNEQFKKRILDELNTGKKSIDRKALPDKIIVMSLPLSGRTQKVDKNKIKECIVNKKLC